MGVIDDVAQRLVRFRIAAGLEIAQAAAAAGISAERLADAESAKVALGEDEIVRVAATYGLDATEIFGGRITPVRDYAGGA